MNAKHHPVLPKGIVIAACFSALLVLLPIASLAVRAPWGDFGEIVTRPSTLRALGLSLFVSFLAACLCAIAGLPLGLLLGRGRFRGKAILRALVLLPLVAPPVVGGVALLAAFGRRGFIGRLLGTADIFLPFTTAGAVLAATFVSLPLMIIVIENGVRSSGHALEEAAETLGASPAFAMRAVTLPLLRHHMVGGFVIAWSRALGEFGATITFAGNISGRTQTLPLAVFETLQTDPGGAVLLSVLLLLVSVGALVALRGRLIGS